MDLTTTVRTPEGRRFQAPVANLTPSTVFVRTAQPLAFRDVLEITLLDHTVRAVVIFACEHPRGAVIWFESPEPLKKAIRAVMPSVPVEAPVPVDADAWREITNTEADIPSGAAREPLEETGTPFDTTSSVAGSEDLEAPWSDASVLMAKEAAPAPEPVERQGIARINLEPARPASDGARAPKPTTSERPSRPTSNGGLEPTPRRAAPADPAPTPPQPAAAPPAVSPHLELPQLERDGCTVRFSSVRNYREQFESHLTHGGLVAAAEPMPVGTQRMLLLAVPGARAYTVSARVVFNQPGVVGFMLDSFGLHRDRLKAMTG